MASLNSKLLTWVSVAGGLGMAFLSILGYGPQVENATSLLVYILPITAGGGLVVKGFESMVAIKQAMLASGNLKNVIAEIVKEAESAQAVAKKMIEAGPVENRTN